MSREHKNGDPNPTFSIKKGSMLAASLIPSAPINNISSTSISSPKSFRPLAVEVAIGENTTSSADNEFGLQYGMLQLETEEETGGGGGGGEGGGNFWRVVPARELRWVGIGWLCSAVYVTTSTVGSVGLRSTCFRATHPFELLHL